MLLSLLAFFQTASASSYGNIYSLAELSDSSSKIVKGKVANLEAFERDGKIYTRVSVEVDKTFVGARSKQASFEVLGGTLNGLTLNVSGSPVFEEQQQGLFFLDKQKIVGFGQGVFDVNNGIAIRGFKTNIHEGPNDFDIQKRLPDEEAARNCLMPKVETAYNDGWSMRSLGDHHVGDNQQLIYPITVLQGNTYRIIGCTDEKSSDIMLSIIDRQGKVLQTETEVGREAELKLQAEDTFSGYLLVTGIDLQGEAVQSGISIGVFYQ